MNMYPTRANDSGRSSRGEIEKHRRMRMKSLYLNLASALPSQNSKGNLPLPALLDQTLSYVNNLKGRIEELKAKKERLESDQIQPNVVVHEAGASIEVNLVTGLNHLTLTEILRILEEEGAQVVNANYSTSGRGMIYTIHCQALSSRIGIETSRVHERLINLLGQE